MPVFDILTYGKMFFNLRTVKIPLSEGNMWHSYIFFYDSHKPKTKDKMQMNVSTQVHIIDNIRLL